MLTSYLPYPLWSGGQIRTYNLLKNLSRKHEITLFSFIRDEKEKKYIPHLKKYCVEVKVFKKRPPWSFTSLALSAVTYYPLVVCMYLNRVVRQEIAKAISEKHFDLIHAETFYVMPNIPETKIPIILVEQTIEYLVYQHFKKSVKLFPLRLLMQWDVTKIKYWEKRFWQKATHVVAMSETDRQVMVKMVRRLTVDLVPNGVDQEFFEKKNTNIGKKGKTVLFVGNFKWLQNREAVSILVKNIWPRILNKLPDAKLWIVGRFPTGEIHNFASGSVEISSDIDDIRNAYLKSDVLLAPIYGPGGTRYKILEAMASGLPVVTTPTGIEGIGAVNNKHALICGNEEDFVKKTVNLLTDRRLYRTLVINGRKLVVEKFNWEIITRTLDRIYQEAAREKKS